jgi:hypothetical protein
MHLVILKLMLLFLLISDLKLYFFQELAEMKENNLKKIKK